MTTGIKSLAVSAVLLFSSAVLAANVPQILTQQGRLLNTDGTSAVGPVSVTFAIYDTTSFYGQLIVRFSQDTL